MSPDQGRELLSIARYAIASALEIKYQLNIDERATWLQEIGACFVTIMQDGHLRGCIGSLEAQRSLLMDVKKNAVSAAFSDSRFIPLGADEFDEIDIEISVLSPMLLMQAKDEADALAQLRPGIDGIVFQYGCYRSTFLPQVWARLQQPHQFLCGLKKKAGLPSEFWSEQVKLSRYTITKWCEADNREKYLNG